MVGVQQPYWTKRRVSFLSRQRELKHSRGSIQGPVRDSNQRLRHGCARGEGGESCCRARRRPNPSPRWLSDPMDWNRLPLSMAPAPSGELDACVFKAIQALPGVSKTQFLLNSALALIEAGQYVLATRSTQALTPRRVACAQVRRRRRELFRRALAHARPAAGPAHKGPARSRLCAPRSGRAAACTRRGRYAERAAPIPLAVAQPRMARFQDGAADGPTQHGGAGHAQARIAGTSWTPVRGTEIARHADCHPISQRETAGQPLYRRLPLEVWEIIASFTPRHHLRHWLFVSPFFRDVAQRAIFRTVDVYLSEDTEIIARVMDFFERVKADPAFAVRIQTLRLHWAMEDGDLLDVLIRMSH